MTDGIMISRAALHALLTDAHVAMVEHRPQFTSAILHVLRAATAPGAAEPQGLARRLDETDIAAGGGDGGGGKAETPTGDAVKPLGPEAATAAPPTSHAPTLAAEEAQPAHQQHLPDGGTPSKRGRQGEHPPSVWTPARVAMLRDRYPHEGGSAGLLADINALPGKPVATLKAVHATAKRIGLRVLPEVARMISAAAAANARAARLAQLAAKPPGSTASKWTRERLDLLAADYPTCTDRPALWERINALPGEPIGNVELVRQKAKELGIKATPETLLALRAHGGRKGGTARRQPAPPAPAPTIAPPADEERSPEEQAAIADAAVLTKQDRVRASLRRALREHKGSPPITAQASIASQHGLPLREVMRLMGEVRQEGSAAA